MRRLVVSISVALLAGFTLAAPSAGAAPLRPIPSLDVARYVGTWYQIAANPAPFNLQCARDTRAVYAVKDARNVSVRNSCTTWTGQKSQIVGNARVNDAKTKAQLHVSFPSVPGQGSLAGRTNYIVAAIDSEYSWAIVGDPSRLSGFVLSRTPNVSMREWARIRYHAERLGYNTCLILTSPTTGGLDRTVPLCALR